MNNCKINLYLAYGMLTYIFASIFYLIQTLNIGTPFNDSLTEEQKRIKQQAVQQRKTIFYQGVIFSLILLLIIKPFETCI